MGILNTLIKTKPLTALLTYIAATVLFLIPVTSYSVSQTPLFLQQRVQPNIMLLLDDSSSMKQEVLLHDATPCVSDCYLDFTPTKNFLGFNITNPDAIRERKLRLCPGYNTLMFNPSKTYTPWDGEDAYGHTYQDAKLEKAQENPFLASTNTNCSAGNNIAYFNNRACDLTTDMGPSGHGAYYYPWADSNGDGKYQPGECLIKDEDRIWVEKRDLPGKQMSEDEQKQFANWFSYYRRSEYVMKRALSGIISESQERVGMATLNRSAPLSASKSSYIGTEIADLDTTSLPINQEAITNKKNLLHNLFSIKPSGATPIRKGLNNVGRYFEEGNSIGDSLFGYTPKKGSPILSASKGGECQQNFVVALSDGHWNGSFTGIGNADGDSNTDYDGRSYADDTANTLADVAMYYYERDLNTSLANDVPTTTLLANGNSDDNPAQHLVTYTVAFGLSSTIPLDCYPLEREDSVESQGWPSNCPGAPGNMSAGWPMPVANTATTIDDMFHAAWNGRGEFLNATDPKDLIDKLGEAIEDIASRSDTTTAATAVTFNSTNMRSGGIIYQAGFDPKTWAGQLFAYKLTGNTLTEIWAAHTQLSTLSDPSNNRVVITYNGTTGIPFSFPADYQNPDTDNGELHPDQIRDLLANARYPFDTTNTEKKSANQAFGESIVEYLRGSHDNEGSSSRKFRPRIINDDGDRFLLADIIHSAPVFVGSPNPAQYPDFIEGTDNSYHTWANSSENISRKAMVYVGTNGGSLHGFNATTGAEEFVYIPKSIFSDADNEGLHWLTERGYTHRYYVDQTPVISNVFISGSWKTILVSGLRGGGKGLFALDITTPTAFAGESTAAQKVLWEFTHDNLGYTFSQPTLAKLNNGKWAAIFGNGYDNSPNGDGKARLFIIDLSDGSIIRSVDTGVGTIANNDCDDASSQCNGLSTPAVVDLNGDGIADRAYAGDLQGNMWVFDLSSTSSTAWNKSLLFKAEINSTPQPITSRPAVTIHPHQTALDTAPNTMVFFGTGQYINKEDIDNTNTQSFYGIWDNGQAVLGRDQLVAQGISHQTTIIDGISYETRTMTGIDFAYSDEQRGWYINFAPPEAESKERIIVNPITFGQLVIFTTTIPDQNVCGIAGGSWLMVLDSNSGGRPKFTALDINHDGLFSEKDMVNNLDVSGIRSGDLYWQPSIIQTGSGNSGTIILPKDNESSTEGVDNNRLDQTNIQGMLPSRARSSWSRFNF